MLFRLLGIIILVIISLLLSMTFAIQLNLNDFTPFSNLFLGIVTTCFVYITYQAIIKV